MSVSSFPPFSWVQILLLRVSWYTGKLTRRESSPTLSIACWRWELTIMNWISFTFCRSSCRRMFSNPDACHRHVGQLAWRSDTTVTLPRVRSIGASPLMVHLGGSWHDCESTIGTMTTRKTASHLASRREVSNILIVHNVFWTVFSDRKSVV